MKDFNLIVGFFKTGVSERKYLFRNMCGYDAGTTGSPSVYTHFSGSHPARRYPTIAGFWPANLADFDGMPQWGLADIAEKAPGDEYWLGGNRFGSHAGTFGAAGNAGLCMACQLGKNGGTVMDRYSGVESTHSENGYPYWTDVFFMGRTGPGYMECPLQNRASAPLPEIPADCITSDGTQGQVYSDFEYCYWFQSDTIFTEQEIMLLVGNMFWSTGQDVEFQGQMWDSQTLWNGTEAWPES